MNEWLNAISESIVPGELGLDICYPSLRDLLPIAVLCVISLLCILLWLVAVWQYAWPKDRHFPESHVGR